ncbi:MAG TPA: COX15/CtaA family protein [Candidatus Eisenbacteria bacterium]|nr:COX15/CtaA family protein [Candidatus Eisenbacteria bacterium]
MDSRPRRLPALLSFALVLTLGLVVWGGVVRLSGSGLAIPDWPLAEGKLLPKPHPNVLIEYGHRFLAMLVSFTTLAIAIVVFRSRLYRPRLAGLTIALLITLVLQVFMGARVVLDELPVDRVVAHLLLAFTFFGILVTMRHRAGDLERAQAASGGRARGLARFAHIAAGLVFLQAGLGAWTSSSGAALACPDFPTCHGLWLPPMEGLVGIHYAHRLGGYVVFLTVLLLCVPSLSGRLPSGARWALRLSGILVAIQLLLGIGNVLLRVPLPVSAAHLGTALVLFGALLTAAHELRRA